MQKRFFLVILSVAGLVFSSNTTCVFGVDEKIVSERSAAETHVLFYGKIVDQLGDPVPGAAVLVKISHADRVPPVEKREVTTDDDGRFVIDGGKGSALLVDEFEKSGYVFESWEGTSSVFNYLTMFRIHIPEESNPVIYKMRKMAAEPTFIFKHISAGLKFDDSNDYKTGFDAMRSVVDPNRRFLDKFLDIEAEAHWEPGSSTGEIILSANGDDLCGFVTSDHFWGMAPESGYQKQLVIHFEDREADIPKYLYVRSRIPAVYSRFKVGSVAKGKNWLALYMGGYTNPYGDRNLEEANGVTFYVQQHVKEQIKKAYAEKRPVDSEALKELVRISRGLSEEDKDLVKKQLKSLSRNEVSNMSTEEMTAYYKERAKKK